MNNKIIKETLKETTNLMKNINMLTYSNYKNQDKNI